MGQESTTLWDDASFDKEGKGESPKYSTCYVGELMHSEVGSDFQVSAVGCPRESHYIGGRAGTEFPVPLCVRW